jgi:hypothetical protein
MIYLLKSPCWNPNYVRYKIGYTSDINRRLKQYEPETSLVATRPGERVDEQILHLRMRLLSGLVRVHRKEWYVVKKTDYQIREVFHEPKEFMEKAVWYATSLEKIPENVQRYLFKKIYLI